LVEIITLQIEIPWFWMVLEVEDSFQICNMDWAILSGHKHSANQCPRKLQKLPENI
jgi:hypothetical protein